MLGEVDLQEEVAQEADALLVVGLVSHCGKWVEPVAMVHDVVRTVGLIDGVGGPAPTEDVIGHAHVVREV